MIPVENQVKLNKLRRLANAADPLGVAKELEVLEDKNTTLEQALLDARNTFKEHIQAIDDILKQLEEKKLNVSEFQAFGEQMKQTLGTIKLIPGPKGDKGDPGPKPVAGVDYVIPRDGRDGRDGKNPVKGVDYFDGLPGKDGLEIAPDQIRDKLESLQDDQRLSISAIHKLEEILDELRQRPVGRMGGGGFSKIHLESKIIDDETPSGTVNGSNTAFTLANTPNPDTSLKVYVNGQRMKGGGEDYSVSGRTITFVTAPPTTSILLCDYRI